MMNNEYVQMGTKAYHDGFDINNVPSYLSDAERLDWMLGYEAAMYNRTVDNSSEIEDDQVEELDFE